MQIQFRKEENFKYVDWFELEELIIFDKLAWSSLRMIKDIKESEIHHAKRTQKN